MSDRIARWHGGRSRAAAIVRSRKEPRMKKKLKLEVLNKGRTITEVARTDLAHTVGGIAASLEDSDGGGGGGSNIGCGGPASCFT
jgi:hypothetical protein